MSRLTLGVAGHIDHGKTSLVRALTGVETDRLKEEKERGMSIVLGFAPLVLPSGAVVDFVDVPGHEKFVGAMIAGASGIDALLLAVDAVEGVKPQTAEHLLLAALLGIKRGIVALTKADLLTSAQRQSAASRLCDFLAGTFLSDAPLLVTSATSGEGLNSLREAIALLAESTPPRPLCALAYLPIDRSFVMTGHGTVVTGTLHGLPLNEGAQVEIVPRGLRSEARGIQVHGEAVGAASAGGRVAVNLRGIKKDEIRKGDALASPPGRLRPTSLLDVEVTVLGSAERPLARGSGVRLHFGTGDYDARVYPLDRLDIAAGAAGYAQLRLSAPVAVPIFTPYVLRVLSPPATIGGGRILDTHPERRARNEAVEGSRLLDALRSGDSSVMVAEKLRAAGPRGRLLTELLDDLGLPRESGTPRECVLCPRGMAAHRDALDEIERELLATIDLFHAASPREEGLTRSTLHRSLSPATPAELLDAAIAELAAAGDIAFAGPLTRRAGFVPLGLTSDETRVLAAMENSLRRARLAPPEIAAITRDDPVRRALFRLLVKSGAAVETTDRATGRAVYFHAAALAEAERRICPSMAATADGLTVAEITRLLATSRKYSIPLLEHFDAIGKTRRIGDRRVWTGDTEGSTRPTAK